MRRKSILRYLLLLPVFYCVVVSADPIDDILEQADSVRTSHPVKSLELLSAISEESLDSIQKEHYSYLMAFSFLMKGESQEGIKRLEHLLNISQSARTKARTLSALLNVYSGLHEWENAFKTINALQAVLVNIQDPSLRDYAELATVSFYNNIKEYKTVNIRATALINSTESDRTKCSALTKLLYANLFVPDSNVNEGDFQRGIDFCHSIGEEVSQLAIISNLAEFYIKTNSPEKASALLIENIDLVKRLNYDSLTSYILAQLVEAYTRERKLNQVVPYARDIIDNFSLDDFYYPHMIANKALSEVYEQRGYYKQALDYFKEYKSLETKDYDDELASKLAIQKAKIELDNRIILLNKENRLLTIESDLAQQKSKNMHLLLFGTSLLLAISITWLFKNRRTQRQLRKMAETDELTGICNRHYFNSQAQVSLDYCQQTEQSVSFILFDLDYFKSVNDNFGHPVGDWALKQCVLAVQKLCRANDLFGRMGGEEFAILLPGCGAQKANQLAESYREAIAKIDTLSSGHEFSLTASFGISDGAESGYNLEALFINADKALYFSKHEGRNRVCTYQAESMSDDPDTAYAS